MRMPQQASISVASWNIEKSGQSSSKEKRMKVSDFIQRCRSFMIDVIFLCEIHSAREIDMQEFLSLTQDFSDPDETYNVLKVHGGNSNSYILLVKKALGLESSGNQLKGLNRDIVLLSRGETSALALAHFKSGRTALTSSQLREAASFLDENYDYWAITGDMNWDFNERSKLTLPAGATGYTSWGDKTHRDGGILDWCLASGNAEVQPNTDCLIGMFGEIVCDMKGPDHRPVFFVLKLF